VSESRIFALTCAETWVPFLILYQDPGELPEMPALDVAIGALVPRVPDLWSPTIIALVSYEVVTVRLSACLAA